MSRVFGIALFAGIVVGTIMTEPQRVIARSREMTLADAFPALRPAGAMRSTGPLPAESTSIATLIPDPLLRPPSGPADSAYDNALSELLKAQVALRLAQEAVFNSRGGAGRAALDRVDSARLARDVAEDAVREAGAIRDQQTDPETKNQLSYRGTPIERNTILIKFRDTASVEAIQDFLDREHFVVRSGNAMLGSFVVEMAEAEPERTLEGDATWLRAVIDHISENTSLIEVAVQDTLLGPDSIPRLVTPPTTPQARHWFSSDDALVNSKFPQAWNFNRAIAAKGGHVVVGVLDVGFYALCAPQQPCDLDVHFTGPPFDPHGTAVASVIGAGFDDGVGLDGAVPFASVYGWAAMPPDCDQNKFGVQGCKLLRRCAFFHTYINDGLPYLIQTTKAQVVNASIGYNWINMGNPQSNPQSYPQVQRLIERQGTVVRDLMKMFPDAVLVASAGNDSRRSKLRVQSAAVASPFNWAALGGAAADRSPNVIVVEALQKNGTDVMDVSNDGGSIQAIGEDVLSIVDVNRLEFLQDTSAATPLVTSAVALMLCNDSSLKVAAIKTALLAAGGKLNAFDALRVSAGSTADAEVADLAAPYGQIDNADFEQFKKDYQQVRDNKITGDLNGDGVPASNDSMFCRADLNGDGNLTADDLDVLIRAWSPPLSADAIADLKKRLEH